MVTEIRDYGDNRTIVVYTNENTVASNLKARKQLLKEIEYCQDTKHGIRCVGEDFYFPKRQLRSICKSLGNPQGREFTLNKYAEITF